MQIEEISSSFIEQLHCSDNADSLAPSGAVKTGNLRVAKPRQREPVVLGALGAAGVSRWKALCLGPEMLDHPGKLQAMHCAR